MYVAADSSNQTTTAGEQNVKPLGAFIHLYFPPCHLRVVYSGHDSGRLKEGDEHFGRPGGRRRPRVAALVALGAAGPALLGAGNAAGASVATASAAAAATPPAAGDPTLLAAGDAGNASLWSDTGVAPAGAAPQAAGNPTMPSAGDAAGASARTGTAAPATTHLAGDGVGAAAAPTPSAETSCGSGGGRAAAAPAARRVRSRPGVPHPLYVLSACRPGAAPNDGARGRLGAAQPSLSMSSAAAVQAINPVVWGSPPRTPLPKAAGPAAFAMAPDACCGRAALATAMRGGVGGHDGDGTAGAS